MAVPTANDRRPTLVMLCNAMTPYRLALHVRLAREMPEVRLESIFTHGNSNTPWSLTPPAEIGTVEFGSGEDAGEAPRPPFHEWRKGGRIIAHFQRNRPAAVVLHGYNDMGRVRVLRWCHAAGIPVFLWGDSNIKSDRSAGAKLAVKRWVLRSILSKTTGVYPCGTLGQAYFERYGADPARMYFVPVEPDYSQIFDIAPEYAHKVATQMRLDRSRKHLIYSGRLAPEKRVDLLLQAWTQLAPTRPDWDLLIVGDGPLRKELEMLVPAELRARTRFLGFQSEQKVVSALYRLGDALCLPSEYEPWALVINEAVAAGLAVVSSDIVGASAELVRDGVNGKIFRTNDLSSLGGALATVTDSSNIDRMKAASRGVLMDWQRRGDPIAGIRKSLVDHGILSAANI